MYTNQKVLDEFTELFLSVNVEAAIIQTQRIIDNGMAPSNYFVDIFSPVMALIGEKFGRLEIFMP